MAGIGTAAGAGGRLDPAAAGEEAARGGGGELAAELARLEALDLGQLRVQYRNGSGRLAPARISRSLLLRVLAYRLQAERFGDLRPDTRRLLVRLGQPRGADQLGATPVGLASHLKPGTMLRREWQGRMEQVMVLGTGFVWNGCSYASLSAAALAITGTRWNGYRFFGLPSPRAAPRAGRDQPASDQPASPQRPAGPSRRSASDAPAACETRP